MDTIERETLKPARKGNILYVVLTDIYKQIYIVNISVEARVKTSPLLLGSCCVIGESWMACAELRGLYQNIYLFTMSSSKTNVYIMGEKNGALE